MSLFKSYTPKALYLSTLRMVNTLFVHPPALDPNPTSYFRATITAHEWIKSDLKGIVPSKKAEKSDMTVEQVHSSLVAIEQMLFGEKSTYDATIKDCCLYTEYLEGRLHGSVSNCQMM